MKKTNKLNTSGASHSVQSAKPYILQVNCLLSHFTKIILPALLIISQFACISPKLPMVHQTAHPNAKPFGAPAYSDVCFSSRWVRPRDERDTFDTFVAARQFHATSLNWIYTTDADFIKKAISLGYSVQVALSPTLPDLPFTNENRLHGRMLNAAGLPVSAPWMKGWNHWWGCVNHPDFWQTYLAHIGAGIDAGVFSFQVDDPAMGFLLLRNKWEDVCYCKHCQRIADSLGLSPPDIQEASVRAFHKKVKMRAEELACRPVTFSCNNFEGDWELFPFSEFDFGVAEVPERRANPEYLYAAIREARRQGKGQIFSFANDREWLVQKMIAATYACGANMLVPWDVWVGGQNRYFGSPEKFAPLFGFVRAVAPWLDGYEDAAYTTTQDDLRLVDTRPLPVSFNEYRRQIHAFVRAKPGDMEAPVVIHLVDWHVLMEPFTIQLNERRFFKKGISSVELITPVEYDAVLHEKAATSGNFAELAIAKQLDFIKDGDLIKLQIPKLDLHWGILIVK